MDFSKVEFVDSTGIGVILGFYSKLDKEGRRLEIINAEERDKLKG